MLHSKEELEKYKDVLMMKEQEAMKAGKEVHLELKKV